MFNSYLNEILELIKTLPVSSRGSIFAKDLTKIAKKICKDNQNTINNCQLLFASNEITLIELGLLILPVQDKNSREVCFGKILELADHSNWEVREYAGEALAQLLRYCFNEYMGELIALRSHMSENIRRAVVISMKYLAKYKELDIYDEIIEVLDVYMDDESQYVKKNLGPFAIGDSLINYSPSKTLKYLSSKSNSENINVKWNVASVFSTATSAKYADLGIPILEKLSLDKSTLVSRTALKSLDSLFKRRPDLQGVIQSLKIAKNSH